MELHVPDTTHGLDLGLESAEVVVVSVVTTLKQVLVTSVARVLIAHPAAFDKSRVQQGHSQFMGLDKSNYTLHFASSMFFVVVFFAGNFQFMFCFFFSLSLSLYFNKITKWAN